MHAVYGRQHYAVYADSRNSIDTASAQFWQSLTCQLYLSALGSSVLNLSVPSLFLLRTVRTHFTSTQSTICTQSSPTHPAVLTKYIMSYQHEFPAHASLNTILGSTGIVMIVAVVNRYNTYNSGGTKVSKCVLSLHMWLVL